MSYLRMSNPSLLFVTRLASEKLQAIGADPLAVPRSEQEMRVQQAMPPTISLEQITGFSLFMLKTVLSGRGDELIDLAKVNLFR